MSWLWGSSTASSSKDSAVSPVAPIPDGFPQAESSSAAAQRADRESRPAQFPSTNAPSISPPSSPSSESSDNTSIPASSGNRYDRILRDEEQYQAKQYPSFEEVPGCMQLFDEFMMCYALVPQLRSFYRRGDFHDCTWKFRDFKYCLSLKSEPEDRRVELWTKRRAEWWAGRRYDGSSEDVWDVRDKPPANFPPVDTEDDQTNASIVS